LEKGRFHWPRAAPGTKSVQLRAEELAMLVSGIDLKHTRPRRGWFRLEGAG
jgi:transposase